MKRIIKGDKNLSHLVVAHAAIDSHEKAYGRRRQGWPSTYLVNYKGARVAVEVVTRRQSYVATVMAGARNLSKLCGMAAA
ncbi:DUF4060 domain-containing protein [Chimaeribacter arupi]|jgi:hypothetical protein|uniref:DUF4060 domain-containing protein n=4 Tax=Yersiniaceae TaxID=1903411 RepID=A0A2N5ET67_9GAMM|nr:MULTISPECIES: DUF4060 family protein [Yersiniaceae]MBS0969949.1 DUF4060 family protein [Nissabacter archeti]MDV5139987.1 DUF4060 family protein [Chimaeribacter arupi]PLR39993.1 DUF4060 domain-containing protein [Chimaeribacter arupi]PLR40448.1 DUF4060 domain-containing protein [Chimaeribacter coloradensis]PLR41488.1 DUF4060 domain-containing protein [Chimaeribacter californicus]